VTSTARVAEFLRVFKERAEKVGGVYVMDRVKNRDALLDLGLTKRQREEIILSLTPEDYCGGRFEIKRGPAMYGSSAGSRRAARSISS
jgi:hypothetical protein